MSLVILEQQEQYPEITIRVYLLTTPTLSQYRRLDISLIPIIILSARAGGTGELGVKTNPAVVRRIC